MFSVARVIALLGNEYPSVPAQTDRRRPPLDELILTILSQNTSDVNSRQSFRRLWSRFGSWQAVAGAGAAAIEEAIKPGGLGRVKAERIKVVMKKISRERGELSLDFLAHLPQEGAGAWLRRLPGVGPKTAACVLLFSLGKPALPVDTHVYRVASRLGMLLPKVSAEKAHDILGGLVPAKDVYRFHVLLIEHGRHLCKAQRPQCSRCPLLIGCPYGALQIEKQREV
ncbi:MAG: endonuclease [Dehalococcoidia bacterium]|nr:endonuclease [Dehalococcoidia bacterium]